jgi:propanol-preferring alcohol dehydrogenase
VLGTASDPIQVWSRDLFLGNRGGSPKSVVGALTGTPAIGDATLRFSVLSGVRPMIETMPLERAPEAYAKMMPGKARFRMVLTTR